ncbi:MAG: LamG domain-containing protein [Candidatus Altiarchaeota archaeon]
MKKYVSTFSAAITIYCLIGIACAYEYAGFDKFVDDVKGAIVKPTPSTTPSSPTTTISPSPTTTLGTNSINPLNYVADIISPSSSTDDTSIRIITPEPILDDVDVKDKSLPPGKVTQLRADYNADVVFNQLTENSEYCFRDCYAEYVMNNKEEIPFSNLRIEFYHDDHTFQQPSDNIISYQIKIWNGESWASTQTIPKGQFRIRIEGTKARDEDTAWRPVIEYSQVRVKQSRWALWKKGAEQTPSTASGVIGLYHFEESGSTSVADSSGNGYNGVSSATIVPETGVLGNAINFSTTRNVSIVTNAYKSGNISISFWIRPNSTGADRYPLNLYSTASLNRGIFLEVQPGGRVGFYTANGTSTARAVYLDGLAYNKWNLITYYRNQTGATTCVERICLNTTCSAEANCPISNGISWGADNVVLGTTTGGGNYLAGRWDELRIYNRIITPSEVSDLYAFTYPVAIYSLNEASGNAADFSGNSYTLGAFNSPTYSQPGVFGSAIKFDGVNDVLNMTSNGFMDISSSNFTISLWTKPTGTPSGGVLVGLRASGFPFWSLQYYDANQGFRISGKNDSSIDYSGVVINNTLPRGVWTNLVVVGYGDSFNVYVNGRYNTTQTISRWKTTTLGFSIGELIRNAGATADNPYNGTIDETIFYRRTLSPLEVQNLYESGLTQLNITSPANNTVFSEDGGEVDAVVGFPDQTIANISFRDISGSWLTLKNNAVETNFSNVKLTKLNATHYKVNATYVEPVAGAYNVTLLAWGGSGLVTSASQMLFFSVNSSFQFGGDSVLRTKYGGLKIMPSNNLLYLELMNLTMKRPDGQYTCCGPDNSNGWVCVSGACG